MEDLPIHKLIVDSRSAGAQGIASNFQIQLPETLYLPHDACCYCTDVAISHTFRSIEGLAAIEGSNNIFYWFEQTYDQGTKLVLNRALLTSNNYNPSTLALELKTQMNAVSIFGSSYEVLYNVGTNSISITLNYQHPDPMFQDAVGFALINEDVLDNLDFQNFASTRLQQGPSSQPYSINWQIPQDCFGVLGNARNSSVNPPWYAIKADILNGSLSQTQTTGAIDVRHRTNLYLHSSALSNNRIVGPSGSRSVICRVPVTQLPGGVERREHSSHPLDFIPIGGRSLSVLDFSIRDSFNRLVTLHGGHVSFELIFSKTPPLV